VPTITPVRSSGPIEVTAGGWRITAELAPAGSDSRPAGSIWVTERIVVPLLRKVEGTVNWPLAAIRAEPHSMLPSQKDSRINQSISNPFPQPINPLLHIPPSGSTVPPHDPLTRHHPLVKERDRRKVRDPVCVGHTGCCVVVYFEKGWREGWRRGGRGEGVWFGRG
jgi:hypothetical protein